MYTDYNVNTLIIKTIQKTEKELFPTKHCYISTLFNGQYFTNIVTEKSFSRR